MTYIESLPKELRNLLYRYLYNDNLIILNKIYKLFEKRYRCDKDGKLSSKDNEKKTNDLLELSNSIKPFNIKYKFFYAITKNYWGNNRLHLIQIDTEEIISDDILFQVIKCAKFIMYIKKIIAGSLYGVEHSILIKINRILKESNIQIYVHYIDHDKYDLVVFKSQ